MTATELTNKPTPTSDPEKYWNRAGEIGYSEAMYSDSEVGAHVKSSIWRNVLKGSEQLGLNKDSNILELGCGDGDLANNFLANHFKSIEAHDLAPAGIERAKKYQKPNTSFYCSDITQLNFASEKRFDAVFFVGILHHVKPETARIIERISQVTDRVLVMEPNGNHLVRKFLEQLPSYRRAGEDSFRKKELERIFSNCGFTETYFKRFNIAPNFTPNRVFPALKKLEPWIENSRTLDFLCTNQVYCFQKSLKS